MRGPNDGAGLKILVHDQTDVPLIRDLGQAVPPGSHGFVGIQIVEVMGTGSAWWRHQKETFSASLAFCAGNSPVPGEFRSQTPVTRSFDVLFDLRLNKRLSKQSWGWWFETPSPSLWRHCIWDMMWSSGSYRMTAIAGSWVRSFEDRIPIDGIDGCPIFKWVDLISRYSARRVVLVIATNSPSNCTVACKDSYRMVEK